MTYPKGEVACTISGVAQSRKTGPVPAIERYSGWHIRRAQDMAETRPLYILSAKWGLVLDSTLVAPYTCALTQEQVEPLAKKVAGQINAKRIRTVMFYCQGFAEPGQTLYHQALYRAVAISQVSIILMPLPRTLEEAISLLPQVADAPLLT